MGLTPAERVVPAGLGAGKVDVTPVARAPCASGWSHGAGALGAAIVLQRRHSRLSAEDGCRSDSPASRAGTGEATR